MNVFRVLLSFHPSLSALTNSFDEHSGLKWNGITPKPNQIYKIPNSWRRHTWDAMKSALECFRILVRAVRRIAVWWLQLVQFLTLCLLGVMLFWVPNPFYSDARIREEPLLLAIMPRIGPKLCLLQHLLTWDPIIMSNWLMIESDTSVS